ncbi:MAG TPA: acyltransferase [Puia sp.]|nr:acyltransferase [Puia sp.]
MGHIQKKHFLVLDGLRGIAALAVVVFHFMEFIVPDYSHSFIGHGFLAVDFFFCLSGFVIAYAYDDRMGKLGLAEFFRSRLIRLHPLVILGSVLGLLGYLFNPLGNPTQHIDAFRIIEIFLCSILLIPFPAMASRFYNLFSFNAPAWSLFWEYIANILYAVVLCRIRRRYLLLLLIPAAAGICFVIYRSGSLLGGWSGGTFWDGFARVSYSFLAGLFIYRSGWIFINRLGFPALAALLALAFLIPFGKWNLLSESLIVLIYFPLLIVLGAGTKPEAWIRRFCIFLGKLSYPLYMTHYWLIWLFGDYYNSRRPTGPELFFVVVVVLTVQLVLAYLVMKLYDSPVRRALSKAPRQRHKQRSSRV